MDEVKVKDEVNDEITDEVKEVEKLVEEKSDIVDILSKQEVQVKQTEDLKNEVDAIGELY